MQITDPLKMTLLVTLVALLFQGCAAQTDRPTDQAGISKEASRAQDSSSGPAPVRFRGVNFNPQVQGMRSYPWLLDYSQYRTEIRTALDDLVRTADMNLVRIIVRIAHTLQTPSVKLEADQPIEDWANLAYLDDIALFIDDCHAAGLFVQVDLACNLWVPYSVDTENHVAYANPAIWPKPDDTPWEEAAVWYGQMIHYIEARVQHPENIAMWCMMGSHHLGGAEPNLWGDESQPEILENTEKFVKYVWPVFRSSGTQPKAAPYMFGIFSNVPYWMAKTPEERLAGFYNLKEWIVDDLDMPPDYWVFTAYPYCDPGPDGFHYLRTIMEVLGPENAPRIIATDLKGPGHEPEYEDTMLSVDGYSGVDMLEWHFQKLKEYGIQHWWLWTYQDTDEDTQWAKSGIRGLDGEWKMDLVEALKAQAD